MSIPITTLLNISTIALVVALFSWYKYRSQRNLKHKSLQIVNVTHLGNREKLIIIELNNQHILLGATQHNIQVLHKYPVPAERDIAVVDAATKFNSSFKSLFKEGMTNEKN